MMKSKGGHITLSLKKLASSFLIIFFILVVVWVQGIKIFPNGLVDQKGDMTFYGNVMFHDSNVHLSLISEMQERFPPTNFTTGGIPLKNYHYFYDVLLALVSKLTGITGFDLYFRIAPVVISVIFSILIYKTVYELTANRLAAAFGILFTVFSTSFGSIMPLVNPSVNGGSNMFMTDQLMDMLVNPQGEVILLVYLLIFLCLSFYQRSNKLIYLFLITFLISISFGVKAYGGIVFAPAILVAAGWAFIKNRDSKPLIFSTIGLIIMLGWIVTSIDRGAAGMQFAPGWLLEKMIVDLDKLNTPRFTLLLQHYMAAGNWLRICLLYLGAFGIYLIGSLGLRIIGLVGIWYWLRDWKNLTSAKVFLLVSAGVSLMIPLLFNQSKKAYDIVQFTPYFTLVMGLLFTVVLFKRYKLWLVLLTVIMLLAQNHNELNFRLFNPVREDEKILISADILSASNYIKKQTPPDAVILLAPSDFNLSYSWFTSVTSRRTVFSGRGFAHQVGVDIQAQEIKLRETFEGKNQEKFDYVFLVGSQREEFVKIKELYKLTPVLENNQVEILKQET